MTGPTLAECAGVGEPIDRPRVRHRPARAVALVRWVAVVLRGGSPPLELRCELRVLCPGTAMEVSGRWNGRGVGCPLS